jgi:hypothetical protein
MKLVEDDAVSDVSQDHNEHDDQDDHQDDHQNCDQDCDQDCHQDCHQDYHQDEEYDCEGMEEEFPFEIYDTSYPLMRVQCNKDVRLNAYPIFDDLKTQFQMYAVGFKKTEKDGVILLLDKYERGKRTTLTSKDLPPQRLFLYKSSSGAYLPINQLFEKN